MSNESENRIDLTQFEGIKKWGVEKRPDGGYAIKTGRDNFSLEEAETTAKLPNLIAELKKTYKVIELLQGHYEDSERHAAFHKEGVCDFLMFDCQYCASK